MQTDAKLIEHLESLSKIELTREEREFVTDDLRQILGYIGKLSQLDTDGVEPSARFALPQELRSDDAKGGMGSREIFKNAPAQKDGYFTVLKTLG